MAAAAASMMLLGIVGTVTAAPAGASGSTPQTISFGKLVNHVYGDTPFKVSATASSGLPVAFSISDPTGACDSSGNNGATITIDSSGTCTVEADQVGNGTYAAAAAVDQTFTVIAATPTISIGNLPPSGSALVGGSFTPDLSDYTGNGSATVSSSTPTVCSSADGLSVYFLVPGTCKLTAQATATDLYQAASGTTQSVTVTAPVVPKCTKSWALAVNGNWSNASDWSPSGVPTSSDKVCVTVATANYTVIVDTSVDVSSLSLGGTAKTETLDISAGQSVELDGSSAISAHGAVTMETNGGDANFYVENGGVLTNAGNLTVKSGDGYAYLGISTNSGVNNTGSIVVDNTLYGDQLMNSTGGSVVVGAGGAFDQGTYIQAGGTSSGLPLSPGTLVSAGGGTASFSDAQSMTVKGGPLEPGQGIDVLANESLYIDNDFTNAGSITMETDGGQSQLNDFGHRLANTGTFTVNAGDSQAYLGNDTTFVNSGTMRIHGTLNAWYYFCCDGGQQFTNTGTIQIDGVLDDVFGSFTNSAGGSISVTGLGSFTGGTFTQAGGSNSGTPLSPDTLILDGPGAASFSAQSMTVQGGTLRSGQTIDIPSNGYLALGGDVTNNGTITMETTDASHASSINLDAHTLTNAGTVDVAAGPGTAQLYGDGTLDNSGSIQIAGSLQNNLGGDGNTVTNDSGGTIAVTGSGAFSGGDFTQDGGSTSGAALSPRTLTMSGPGKSSFSAQSMTVAGGPIQANQSIDIPVNGSLQLANDMTNNGSIAMETDGGQSNLDTGLHTLNNLGTMSVAGGAGSAYVSGTVKNGGAVTVLGELLNEGEFTNGTGGSIAVSGSGAFTDGTFTQAGGSNTGTPLAPSTLDVTGGGSASFTASSMAVEGGPLTSTQSIDIVNGSLSLSTDFENDGTVTMETNGNVSYLQQNGNTFTNVGTFTANAGSGYSYFNDNGAFVNTGTVVMNGSVYDPTNGTFANRGTLDIGTTGSVQLNQFTQASPGLLSFAHDASGASGSLSSSTVGLGGCIGSTGPSLPVGTTLSVISDSSISGQFSCTRFPSQLFNVNYPDGNDVQLVATNTTATTPSITTGSSASFSEGSPNTFTIHSTGTPTPGISEVGQLPSGVTLSDNGNGTATLSGTPSPGSGGTYLLTVNAANGAVPSATQSFTLTVDESPSITSANQGDLVAGTPGSFTVGTYGYPVPALSVSGTLPAGVTFSDNHDGTGTFSGSPSATDHGSYSLVLTASNTGGVGTQAFTLVVDRPPTVQVSASPTQTTVGSQVGFTVTASDPDGDPLSYLVQYGDGQSVAAAYSGPSVSLQHAYGDAGPYSVSVQVTDPAGAVGQTTTTVSVSQGQPLVANAGPDLTTTANDPVGVTLDGSASTPACCILSFDWHVSGPSLNEDFSNKVQSGVTFSAPGTYTATLTVQTGSDSDSASTTVTVEPQTSTAPTVHVTDSSNTQLSGAEVVVLSAAGQQYQASTNASGAASLSGLADGSYTAYVVKDLFDPNQGILNVTNGLGSVTIALTPGGIATTSVSSNPITDEQTLVSDGIDPSDPDNNNIYKFFIHLVFGGQPTTFSGYVSQGNGFVGNGTGFGGGGATCSGFTCDGPSGGGYSLTTEVQYVGNTPELLELIIPVQAEWLKEFYNVSMTVTNLGSTGFTLTGGSAQLELPVAPDGSSPLALPALFNQAQSASQTMADIGGGQSASVNWVVRGDEEGSWNLSATYSGTLNPVNDPVHIEADDPNPIHVWGLSAIQLSVSADATAAVREPYAVTVSIKNVTDSDPSDEIPLFNVGLQYLTEGAVNFIYQPDQQMSTSTPELDPGQSISLSAVIYPDLSGDLLPNLSFVTEKTAGGKVDDTAVINAQSDQGARLTATGKGKPGGVQLKWQAVPGATGYQIWSAPGWPNPIPNPPFLTLTQFSGSPLATVGAVTKDTVTGLPGSTTSEYAIVPLVNGVPKDVQNQLVHATTGASPVTITSFTPKSGAVGAKVTIKGSGLTAATVTFNGVKAKVSSDTATQVVVKVPAGATTGPIKVQTSKGAAVTSTNFTVT